MFWGFMHIPHPFIINSLLCIFNHLSVNGLLIFAHSLCDVLF